MISDATIFLFGCIVTIFVAAAVGLLIWGAARETDVE